MLANLKNIFKVQDLRNKVLFTFLIIALYRLGAHLPVPGIDTSALKQLKSQADEGGVLAFLKLFSGGGLTNFAIFALGIMPYITASIIVQLLTVVIPRFETLKKEGQSGTAKLTQYTRYLTIGLAILQSSGLVAVARTPGRLFSGCDEAIIPDTS